MQENESQERLIPFDLEEDIWGKLGCGNGRDRADRLRKEFLCSAVASTTNLDRGLTVVESPFVGLNSYLLI